MLEFYYDFLCEFIPQSKFECIQMDTDSLYLGLAADSIDEIIKPNKRKEFYKK